MSTKRTELERMEILRLSNQESNRITKECIESALILLMNEKKYDQITITDIVKRAGVSRTAYYRNYSSKEDILQSLVTEFVSHVTASMSQYSLHDDIYKFWLEMFHAARPYADTILILLKANMGETIRSQINKFLLKEIPVNAIETRYAQQFWNGAAFSILTEWISNGTPQSEEYMAKVVCSIIESAR